MEGTFTVRVSDVTLKELNLSKGLTAVGSKVWSRGESSISSPVFLASVPERDSYFCA